MCLKSLFYPLNRHQTGPSDFKVEETLAQPLPEAQEEEWWWQEGLDRRYPDFQGFFCCPVPCFRETLLLLGVAQ